MPARVLIVDDDADLGEELVMALEAAGVDADSAATPDDILTRLRPNVEVIVLDLSMPLDGFDLVDELGRRGLSPAIIISSAQDPRIVKAAVRHAEQAGLTITGALAKPYAPSELVALLKDAKAKAPAAAAADAPLDVERAAREITVALQSKRRLSAPDEIVAYEALLRWTPGFNPERLFEASVPLDAQRAITERIIALCGAAYATLAAAGRARDIAVNLTPELLCDHDLSSRLPALARDSGFAPGALSLELTEHASLNDFTAVASAASRLAMRGFKLAIDDFGRGSTSFERLLGLPLAELKIDKEIFWSCLSGELPAAMLRETIAFCHAHDIAVTVEGIESESHLAAARDLGADYGQGYLWGRPAAPGDLIAPN
ncbi:MAG: EAL domain-containing protein [Alphaproteobacteria bacterium]|nr:EAL domain-containing protein [Alphaproteobacteria bacterium]